MGSQDSWLLNMPINSIVKDGKKLWEIQDFIIWSRSNFSPFHSRTTTYNIIINKLWNYGL